MDHGHMTHSTVVMDGHGKPQEEQLSFWEHETSDEESHHFTGSLRLYHGQWSACFSYRRVRLLAPIVRILSQWFKTRSMTQLLNWIKWAAKVEEQFSRFLDFFIPRSENVSFDSLAKIARSFYRELYYIACFILVWETRPPQAWVIDQPFDVKKKLIMPLLKKKTILTIPYYSQYLFVFVLPKIAFYLFFIFIPPH